jgi:c(7)-type cytochrome triheme protein
MKITGIFIVCIIALSFAGVSFAVPPGETFKFLDGQMGSVVFDGKVHSDKGMKCGDCHPRKFQRPSYAFIDKISKEAHEEQRYCFSCHNGEKAFGINENCGRCHIK